MELFISIGERLREERERIDMSQSEVAAIARSCGVAGATRQSQSLYEKGARTPDAAYLNAVEQIGIDIFYVVVGRRVGTPPLPPAEQLLLDRYRSSPPPLRDAALRVLLGAGETAPVQKVKARKGQVTQSGQIINVGAKGK